MHRNIRKLINCLTISISILKLTTKHNHFSKINLKHWRLTMNSLLYRVINQSATSIGLNKNSSARTKAMFKSSFITPAKRLAALYQKT